MKYKLFISDYDGTLGKAPNYIAKEDVEAIKEYTKKGGIFAISTGRMFCSIQRICNEYGIEGILAAYQGALVKDIKTEKTLYSYGLSVEQATFVVKKLMADGVQVTVDIGDTMYYQNRTDYVHYYEDASRIKGVQVNDLVGLIEMFNQHVPKILAIDTPEGIQSLINKHKAEFAERGVELNSGAPQLMEAINPVYGKAYSVRKMAEYYGVPLSEVIVVGDSTNDISLLSGEWHGVAVGDAHEELKAIADEITVPFDEHPVSALLKKYCL